MQTLLRRRLIIALLLATLLAPVALVGSGSAALNGYLVPAPGAGTAPCLANIEWVGRSHLANIEWDRH